MRAQRETRAFPGAAATYRVQDTAPAATESPRNHRESLWRGRLSTWHACVLCSHLTMFPPHRDCRYLMKSAFEWRVPIQRTLTLPCARAASSFYFPVVSGQPVQPLRRHRPPLLQGPLHAIHGALCRGQCARLLEEQVDPNAQNCIIFNTRGPLSEILHTMSARARRPFTMTRCCSTRKPPAFSPPSRRTEKGGLSVPSGTGCSLQENWVSLSQPTS